MNKLTKVKAVIMKFCNPKSNGMSAHEIARMICAIKEDDLLDDEEEAMARMDAEDAEQAKQEALEDANQGLID